MTDGPTSDSLLWTSVTDDGEAAIRRFCRLNCLNLAKFVREHFQPHDGWWRFTREDFRRIFESGAQLETSELVVGRKVWYMAPSDPAPHHVGRGNRATKMILDMEVREALDTIYYRHVASLLSASGFRRVRELVAKTRAELLRLVMLTPDDVERIEFGLEELGLELTQSEPVDISP